jgi:hypothetical protein
LKNNLANWLTVARGRKSPADHHWGCCDYFFTPNKVVDKKEGPEKAWSVSPQEVHILWNKTKKLINLINKKHQSRREREEHKERTNVQNQDNTQNQKSL